MKEVYAYYFFSCNKIVYSKKNTWITVEPSAFEM